MDKIDKLFDAIEHPDCYSEREIETLLADPEVREVYSVLDKTKASLTPIPTPDIDVEWKEFERIHSKRHLRIFNLFSRNIAASIAICIVSLAAVAAVVGVGVNYVHDKKVEAQAEGIVAITKEDADMNNATIAVEDNPEIVPETIVFDNELLETIVNRIGEYYGCKVMFTTDSPKSLRLYFRWNQGLPIEEVVESLNNFEQIHIIVKDNTIKIY